MEPRYRHPSPLESVHGQVMTVFTQSGLEPPQSVELFLAWDQTEEMTVRMRDRRIRLSSSEAELQCMLWSMNLQLNGSSELPVFTIGNYFVGSRRIAGYNCWKITRGISLFLWINYRNAMKKALQMHLRRKVSRSVMICMLSSWPNNSEELQEVLQYVRSEYPDMLWLFVSVARDRFLNMFFEEQARHNANVAFIDASSMTNDELLVYIVGKIVD